MGWTKAKSEKRIADHLESMGEIEIKPLEREVNDLGDVLSETKCREIDSAHMYGDISNFSDLASGDPTKAPLQYRKLIRGTYVYQRVVGRLVEEPFGGVRVHFQGPRLHALFYRPTDEKQRARKAVLLQLTLADFVEHVFNPEFTDLADLAIRSGSDIGTVIGTKNGVGGDREMLFVGNAANQAAKIISANETHYLTARVYDLLSKDLQAKCWAVGERYRISASKEALDTLLAAEGIVYDRDVYAKIVKDERDAIDLDKIDYSNATERIKFGTLGVYDNKRVEGATIFADLSGFTAYVAAATTETQKKKRLRVFAAIRKELARIAKVDYDGVRVQYQGDRVQVLLHIPKGETSTIAENAVKIALAMQSAMEVTLKAALPDAKELTLAVGIDMGWTLASMYGKRGQRDRMCLGDPVDVAAAIEDASAGTETAVSKRVYDALSESTRKMFAASGTRFVAKGKLLDDYDRAQEASNKYAASEVYVGLGGAAATVTGTPTPGSIPVTPSRSHA
jgi:class 3 adenylate cyclase